MNKFNIAAGLSMAALLVGCDEPPKQGVYLLDSVQSTNPEEDYLNKAVTQEVTPQINQDQKELAEILAELKKGDPLIKDAYYGFNEKGERVLHIVRDEPANGEAMASGNVSETIWPLLGGAAAGMLLAQAMNSSGGYNNYQSSHRPYSYSSYHDSERRKRKNVVASGYTSTLYRSARTKVQTSPSYKAKVQSIKQAQVTARKTAVLSSSSSVRSSSYSSGG